MCASTIEELHAKAEEIGIPKYFFQDCYLPHYSAHIARWKQKKNCSSIMSLVKKYLADTKGSYVPEQPITWRLAIQEKPWKWAMNSEYK